MAEILLVGADKSQTSRIESLLRQDRHLVYLLKDASRWRDAAAARDIDLVVAAISPSERLVTTGDRFTKGFPVPILVVQKNANVSKAATGDDRVVDRIDSNFKIEDLLARADALIRVRRAVEQLTAGSGGNGGRRRNGVAPDGAISRFANCLSTVLSTRVTRFARPQASYVDIASRVANWSDCRDSFEPGHAERVAVYTAMIADGLTLSKADTTTVVRAARWHDIGKVTLPLEILRQKSPLCEDQKRVLRTHAERGATILDALNVDPPIVDAIRFHHARFDGQGQGPKTAGKVPLSARVVAVAEVYDAMTSSQIWRALPREAALERMSDLRGGQLDPVCVEALFDALKPRPAKLRTTVSLR